MARQAGKGVEAFVRTFTNTHGRGCPSGVILYTGVHPEDGKPFTKADIKAAQDGKLIESGRGKEGGFYVYGEKPETVEADPSLKLRMVKVLETAVSEDGTDAIDLDEVRSILADYRNELSRRAEARKAS